MILAIFLMALNTNAEILSNKSFYNDKIVAMEPTTPNDNDMGAPEPTTPNDNDMGTPEPTTPPEHITPNDNMNEDENEENCSSYDMMSGNCNNNSDMTTCDSSHPENCENKNSCEDEGHVWCNNTCYAFNDENLPNECSTTCDPEQIHFVSEYNGKRLEMCFNKNNKYIPTFDNNTNFYALMNMTKEEAEILRYTFPLYPGDMLVDGTIDKDDILDLKARLYPMDEPYDLYLAISYKNADNKTGVLFFVKNQSRWKIQTQVEAFETNIPPEIGFLEDEFGIKTNLCNLLGDINTDITLWYLAFPASNEYSNDLNGLLQRYRTQAHKIEYIILENNCNDIEE
jgi:hypothetical protein